MEENKEVIGNQFDASVPTKVSAWTKIKNFFMQEIKVELTPREAEVFGKINDFWHQDITEEKAYGFLFQKLDF